MANETCQTCNSKNIQQHKRIIQKVILLKTLFLNTHTHTHTHTHTLQSIHLLIYQFCDIWFSYINIKILYCHVIFFRKIMKIPKNQRADIQNMPIGMSKKVYEEMVKELDIIASQEELYHQ
jgi:hypothetical protein